MPLQNLNLKPRPPKGKGTRRRLLGLSALSAATAAVYLLSMMRIQIVDGARYLEETLSTTLSVIPVRAARGEILDRDGEALAENRTGMNIVFYYSFFPQERAAEQIAALIALCEENGESWYDPLPLNEDGTAFTEGSETSVEALREALGLSSYATADDCLYRLCERYGIEEEDPVLRRKIAGACYGMLVREFSLTNNEYTFAQDISLTTALQLKERSRELPGVDIAEEDIRSYPDGTTAPHLIGTVGSMSAEEWETYRVEGYQMSDFVGKFGIERYCESILRGTDGERTVEQGENGEILSEEETVSPQSGNSVSLTIDAGFQQRVQQLLEDYILSLRATGDPETGGNAKGGAIAVLDARSGAVLALATYPSYDISTYYEDYADLLAAENTPLINRAVDGLYRPGSTFKPVVAAAALGEGVISPADTVSCTGVYTYYDTVIEGNTFRPTCLGVHGEIALRDALRESCNIFFYDVGRRTGIDAINEYAENCGLGVSTGLELGGAVGTLTSPEYTESLGGTWTQGNVVQASIGQMDTMVSPLQMAVEAMTIANRGTRYKTYLIDEIRSYDGSELDREDRAGSPLLLFDGRVRFPGDYGGDGRRRAEHHKPRLRPRFPWLPGRRQNRHPSGDHRYHQLRRHRLCPGRRRRGGGRRHAGGGVRRQPADPRDSGGLGGGSPGAVSGGRTDAPGVWASPPRGKGEFCAILKKKEQDHQKNMGIYTNCENL